MLLIGSIWLGILIGSHLPGPVRIEIGPLLVGGTLAALAWRLRRPALTGFVALLTVEELLIWWALTCGAAPSRAVAPSLAVPFLGGVSGVGLLLMQVRLPERGLPLHGIWLRRLLAVGALLALIAWPSWLYLFTRAVAAGIFVWPILPCVFIALWYIGRSAEILAHHSLERDNERASPER